MSDPGAPSLEKRRAPELSRELLARARAWLPQWNPADGEPGRALLEVAARLGAEVAQRLDRVGEKNRRNLYLWLGMRGAAARGARVPVAFKLAEQPAGAAGDAVLARAPVQMQADAGGVALIFESESDLRLVPAMVALVAAIDPAADAFYLPAPGLSDLEPLPLAPVEWRVKSAAPAGATRLQLDPPLGLAAGMILEIDGRQYRIAGEPQADIVTIEPAVDAPAGIAPDAVARKLAAFAPFAGAARNQQNHALYLGHEQLLNLESTARIEVVGALELRTGFDWQYWGKLAGGDEDDWRPLAVAAPDPEKPDALVLQKTGAGAIEKRKLGGAESRWIRAVKKSLQGVAGPMSFGQLKLSVGTGATAAQPALEGLANTTPLVLDRVFLPLGREPRQFDAFYLGCEEVFSKHGARVTLDFKLADTTFRSLSAVGAGRQADMLMAGVAQDGSLHVLAFDAGRGTLAPSLGRESLQPPAAAGARTALDMGTWRVPVWSDGSFFHVAVASGASVWIYSETVAFPFFGFWTPLGPVVSDPTAGLALAGLVYRATPAPPRLFALYEGRLLQRPESGAQPWQPIETLDSGAAVKLKSIAAVAGGSQLVGISEAGALYEVLDSGQCNLLATAEALADDVQPVAAQLSGSELLVFACGSLHDRLVAYRSVGNVDDSVSLAGETVLGLDFDLDPSARTVVAAASNASDSRVLWWTPFQGTQPAELLDAPLVAGAGRLAGAPTRLAEHAVVPGARSEVLVLPLRPGGIARGRAPLELWAVVPSTFSLDIGDLVTVNTPGIAGLARVEDAATVVDDDRYSRLGLAFADASAPDELIAFRRSQPGSAATLDSSTAADSVILLAVDDALDGIELVVASNGGATGLHLVTDVTAGGGPSGETIATLTPALSGAAGSAVTFWPALASGGRSAPVLRLDRALTPQPPLDAAVLDAAAIVFPGADPARQRGTVIARGLGNAAAAIALADPWVVEPTPDASGEVEYLVNGAPGAWSRQLGDTSSNPELSWEYSNGKGWWRLPNLVDGTRHLKGSEKIEFTVPDDLVTSDWAGRSNFWIRARLIGGDYGREVYTVTSTPAGGGATTQSAVRSTEGIRPPAVVSLAVSYSVDSAIFPQQVVTEDAGSFRHQSDANRTSGARVEAFVPLAVAIARLEAGAPAESAPQAQSGCTPLAPVAQPQAAAPATGTTAGRALLIGLEGEARGEPVNLLIAVGKEAVHDGSAPLQVQALVAGRFEPVVAQDGTRAIGETGLITMALAQAPTPAELFGRTLSWLRLAPRGTAPWQPSVAGAWLNAVWAQAAQTQTRELLGSSAGAPRMMLALARPPVLEGTLELRVSEPLGEEEIAELRRGDPQRVLTEVDGLPGTWVRWERTADPDDHAPYERVYALDEASGEVRFGDGEHGMIPPIGRDNVVAFRYRRTEPLAAGADVQSAIGARSALGLVTPLQGVEAAVAAADAGTGAAPDDAARLLRFAPARLRHRGRAVSARDVEDIALQAIPALAQARCLRSATGWRLVVVARGRLPLPSRAILRELQDLLARALPAAIAQAHRLAIEGPTLRPFRVRATLRLRSLDVAGKVAEDAKAALRRRFDSAAGGDDGQGWPLGRAPDEREIAATLVDIADLQGIEGLRIVAADRSPWHGTLRANELAVLADDGFDFSYALPQAVA